MNIAVVFAGGSGSRMHTKSRPKQFLELNGKPILIYTLELFEDHPLIDAIVCVCIEPWIPFLKKMVRKYELSKVVHIVPGGTTGQNSIFKGLCAVEQFVFNEHDDDTIVLIHDGVRPLILEKTITDNIQMVKQCGSCVTVVPAVETILVGDDEFINIPPRNICRMARAPQSFYLSDILSAHRKAQDEGLPDFIDSCSLMHHYGKKIAVVEGPFENIKITTPSDFYLFRAMVELRENQQIFGF